MKDARVAFTMSKKGHRPTPEDHVAEQILELVERHLAKLPADEREARLKDFKAGLAEEVRRLEAQESPGTQASREAPGRARRRA